MLNDWLWAITLTACIWLEVGGWSRFFTRLIAAPSDRARIGSRLTFALGFCCMAQFYFTLSLLGRGTPTLHLCLLVIGVILSLVPPREHGNAPHLHLMLARSFSPLTWKRAWPWLALPIAWAVLRVIDALFPHGSQLELSYNLFAPRQWLETGRQQLDPLHPLSALASVWEGLYYHAFSVIRALHPVQRSALVRGQLTAQLLHLTAGQMLSLFIIARLTGPFVRAGWDTLAHADSSAGYRHRVGMASTVAVPASLFFAWMACGQSQSGALASNDWGAAMFVLSALALASESSSLASAALAGLFWGSATATHFDYGLSAPGLLLAMGAATIADDTPAREWRRNLARRAGVFAAGGFAALVPWLARNWSQAGELFYPHSDLIGERPGWFSEHLPSVFTDIPTPWARTTWFILALGLPALSLYLWRARLRVAHRGMAGLLVFAAAGGLVAIFREELDLATGAAMAAGALVGLEYLVTLLRRPLAAEVGRHAPLVWLALGLFCVPLPFHLLWQDLPQVVRPADNALSQVVTHFNAKLWASVSLPRTTRLAWTSDTEFYYLDQPAASIRESSILHDALARATTPPERVSALCELGFDVLAWEDRGHGPETAGLGTWLRLSKTAFLHAAEDVTFFDLHCK